MFNEKQVKFIKSQNWYNEFIPRGKAMIKSDLSYYLEGNEKVKSVQDLKTLGLTDTGIILFYAELLVKLDSKNEFNNCSVILARENIDIHSISKDCNDFFLPHGYKFHELSEASILCLVDNKGYEPDEDFDIDDDLLDQFYAKMKAKYGIELSIPGGYWGK